MSFDIESNLLRVGDIVFICDAVIRGSDSKRMLRGEVLSLSLTGARCEVKVYENGFTYRKNTRTVAKAYSNCT